MIIWLSSFPRSGNTLIRTILYQVFGVNTYSIYENQVKSEKSRLSHEVIETIGALPFKDNYRKFIIEARESPEPIFIKTHHRPESDEAAIYIVRNGIVATDSYRHFLNAFTHQMPNWSQLVQGKINRMPTWFQHLDAWNPLERSKTLVIKYEDLVSKRVTDRICEISKFCELDPLKEWTNPWKKMHHLGPNFFRRGRPTIPPEITSNEKDIFLATGNNREWMRILSYDVHSPLLHRSLYRMNRVFNR